MQSFSKKDERSLAYEAGKKRIRQEWNLLGLEVLNEAFDLWYKECEASSTPTELTNIEDVKKYLQQAIEAYAHPVVEDTWEEYRALGQ